MLETVTIIIPCLNEEKYIAHCLDSVLANEYADHIVEIFVVDGMSSDETRKIVGEYEKKHKKVKLLDNPKKTAVSPYYPTLAEQCIGNTTFSGIKKFITEKIDFLISPAY